MRKIAVLAFLLVLVCGAIAMTGYGRVPKPEVRGAGPLAIQVAAGMKPPAYHDEPSREFWIGSHGARVDATGVQQCLGCHQPETSCNHCHSYVGVSPIPVSGANLAAGLATPTALADKGAGVQHLPRTQVPGLNAPTAAPTLAMIALVETPAVERKTTTAPAASPTAIAEAVPHFAKDIMPILQDNCVACHGGFGGWYVTSYDTVMNTGDNKPVIVPGKPEDSLLIQKLTKKQKEGTEMPPGGALSQQQIDLFIRWIAAGAPN